MLTLISSPFFVLILITGTTCLAGGATATASGLSASASKSPRELAWRGDADRLPSSEPVSLDVHEESDAFDSSYSLLDCTVLPGQAPCADRSFSVVVCESFRFCAISSWSGQLTSRCDRSSRALHFSHTVMRSFSLMSFTLWSMDRSKQLSIASPATALESPTCAVLINTLPDSCSRIRQIVAVLPAS